MKTWEDIKKGGSGHYKTGSVEPIDLYRSLGILREWAIGEICQHALRNIRERDTFVADMVFYMALRDLGVPEWKAGIMYKAVRLFAGRIYEAYRRKDKEK